MAFLAAAPEAEAAAGAVASKAKAVASKAKGGRPRKAPVPDPRDTHPGSEAARQRQAVEEVKAARKPEPAEEEAPPAPPSSSSSKAAAPLFTVGPADKWHTGSGLVLGSVAWVLFMNFMQGGMPQVRRWGAAKFLNRTPQVGGSK